MSGPDFCFLLLCRFSEPELRINYKLQLQITCSLEHRVEHNTYTHVIHAVGLVLLYKILYH